MRTVTVCSFTLLLFLQGCTSSTPPTPQPPVMKHEFRSVPIEEPTPKVAPTSNKEVALKEVEDTNYSSEYMYPKTEKKVTKEPSQKDSLSSMQSASSMNKQACIDMIGQAKFEQYAQMFGSEEASIKRCNMIQRMHH